MAGLRFRMLGGYEIFPGPSGAATPYAPLLQPADVEEFLWRQANGQWPYATIPIHAQRLPIDLRVFLARYKISSVIDVTGGPNGQSITQLFTTVLGRPTDVVDGVDLWLDAPALLRGRPSSHA
jgi:hypothetical protein